jgi:puromycin-sensitive aminopeptidase
MQKRVRLPEHVIPERYQIMFKPEFKNFTFEGEETIFLSLSKPTTEIIVHADELKVTEAVFKQNQVEMKASKIKYDKKSETVIFSFPSPISPGKGQLYLKFSGILNDKMRGFYHSKYELNGEEKHLATSQFEPTDSRRAFPCLDEPSQKAIFDITLMVPKGHTAISNTLPIDIAEHESGYQIVKFSPTPKMSTYLLAFIVGDFEFLEGKTKHGVLVRVFTTPGKKSQAKFALDVAIKTLDFYDDYFKIPYPLPVLDMIAIPDFAAGAMENWGAVTYRESMLLVDPEKTSLANKQWVALVIAHELAHQWFGNLVTMKWWTHLWLNEGFASFIEFLAIDYLFPQWDIWTQFVDTEMASGLSLDALKNTHPIEVEVYNPAQIGEIFDRVSYEKGASVLRMLWKYLGEKDFQKGLQLYLKRHAYSNAETAELWQALEEASGKPVKKVMKNWTSKPGHPLVRVQVTGDRLQLIQSRFFSSSVSKRKTRDKTIWSIPLTIQTDQGEDQILMDKKTISIPKPKDDGWLKLNTDEVSFIRVDYPAQYLRKLEEAILKNKLSAPDRLGLIRDSFALSEAGSSPTSLALELVESFKKETDYTVWSELSANLGKLDSLLALEKSYLNFRNYGRDIYSQIATKMGWEKKKGEKHTDSLLRSLSLYKFGSFGDKETIKHAQKLFADYLAGGKISPDLKGVVYNLVTENGGNKEFSALLSLYKKEDNHQEKDRIGRSLGLFKTKTLLSKALEFAISKYVRPQNSLGIIGTVWGNPEGRYLAWEFVKKNWQFLKDRYAGSHYFTRVFIPMGEFTKTTDAKEISAFIKKHPVPEAQRTLSQALEQIESNVEWLKRDGKTIAKFLERY